MKKMFSIIFSLAIFGICNCYMANAASTYNITPKPPKITPSLKPIITKYRQANYIGAMQDLEELVKTEKDNIYAKYYLALCYTRLGYKEEAQILYKEIVKKDQNLALTYYSQRALDCLDDPNNTKCQPPKKEQTASKTAELDDMDLFIQSGKMIHPAAMDRITRERMERKLQQSEYQRKMQEEQEQNTQLQSQMPTNEEIASALNTLSKIGINPFERPNIAQLMQYGQMQQYSPYNLLGNNLNPGLYNAQLSNNINPEIAKMFLYNNLTQNSGLAGYGI